MGVLCIQREKTVWNYVTIDSINVTKTIENAEHLLKKEKGLSPAMQAMLQTLLLIIKLLCDRLNLNSSNSSKPPSSDPNRAKPNRPKSKNPPGGQKGHKGTTLKPFENPDVIKVIPVEQEILPSGQYQDAGYLARQEVNIKISREVTEYRAQILVNKNGRQFIAPFPPGLNRPIQYGPSLKSHAVYLSAFQLIPYERIQNQFQDQYNINISTGSINNFNCEAAKRLEDFKKVAINQLILSSLGHADETSVNIDGKKHWLHGFSNEHWAWLYVHKKRGTEAMNEIGILPHFKGILCHDHWKSYYKYDCTHSLCNAHHSRELTRAWEQDNQKWAQKMDALLQEVNVETKKAGGELPSNKADNWQTKYLQILEEAEAECPPPEEPPPEKKKRGRTKRSKARNLLERLRDFREDVLRFMRNKIVPFTNNLGEREIRMIKVQQKISGCFRSLEGARNHCIIRSYILTCQKNGIGATEALDTLFQGRLPEFIQKLVDQLPAEAE